MTVLQSSLIRGETYSLALEAVEGDITGATARADLKRALNGGPPPDTADVMASFEVDAVEHVVPGGGAGWIFTLQADETDGLEAGTYVMDARITLASGFVDQVDAVRIVVKNRVTA